jgi:hypothetical protein
MSPAAVDRRVRRTRALLHRALLDLIAAKGYDRVTGQRSGSARSRFGRSRPPSTSSTLPVM